MGSGRFEYDRNMPKPHHVVAGRSGAESFSVACFDDPNDAKSDAEARNHKAKKWGLNIEYRVDKIENGVKGPPSKT